MKEHSKHAMFTVVLALGLGLVALAIFLSPQPDIKVTTTGGAGPTQANTISVTGASELTVAPDQAELYIRIVTEEPTANTAQEENSRLTNTVRDALKNTYDLEEEDIESSSYNLWPQQHWDRDTNKYIKTGYRVQHLLKVTTDEIEEVGNMLDTAVSNGANGVDRISFTLSKEYSADVRDQALSRAAENARDKATALSQTLGVTLGGVSSVSESNYYSRPYEYAPMADMEMAEAGAKSFSTEISPQDVTVRANLNVAYELK
ncbi:SIMPL domain-containing protein [Nanoarchaeota archaeon]